MASRTAFPRRLFRPITKPKSSLLCLRCRYSTEAPSSPILSKLREDLKGAMRAKDTARLSVLRSILADITNQSKTPAPIKDDLALLSLLRKRIGAAKGAVEEFKNADRGDLVEKEQAQVNILEEYAGGVKTVDVEEVRGAVKGIIGGLKGEKKKVNMGEVLKVALGPGSVLEGRPVQKSEVVRVIKEELGTGTA